MNFLQKIREVHCRETNLCSDITSVVDAWVLSEGLWWIRARHGALPQYPLLVFPLVLRQLTGNAVHDSTVMEDDQITLFPSVSIDIFSCIDLLLHVIDYAPDLFDIIHHGCLSCLRIACGEFIDATAVYLKERSAGIEWIPPDHLINRNQ